MVAKSQEEEVADLHEAADLHEVHPVRLYHIHALFFSSHTTQEAVEDLARYLEVVVVLGHREAEALQLEVEEHREEHHEEHHEEVEEVQRRMRTHALDLPWLGVQGVRLGFGGLAGLSEKLAEKRATAEISEEKARKEEEVQAP